MVDLFQHNGRIEAEGQEVGATIEWIQKNLAAICHDGVDILKTRVDLILLGMLEAEGDT